MEDRETPRMHKYRETKTTRIIMATTSRHCLSGTYETSGRLIFFEQSVHSYWLTLSSSAPFLSFFFLSFPLYLFICFFLEFCITYLIDKYPSARLAFLFLLQLFHIFLLAVYFEVLYHIRSRFELRKIKVLFIWCGVIMQKQMICILMGR